MPPASRRWLLVIILAGAVLRLVPIWFGLPYPQARPDEETALGRALDVIDGKLNPDFFHWPSLTFYVFAGALQAARVAKELIGSAHEFGFSEHALIGRGVVAVAGTATIFILFRLAQLIAGVRPALLAAGFLAVAILHVRESHFAMTDVLATMLTVASLALLLRAGSSGPDRGAAAIPRDAVKWSAAAGLAAGLAASTKYSAAALGVSMLAAQFLWFRRAPRLALSWRNWIPSVAYGTALLAGFLIATPYAVLDYDTFSRDFRFNFTHLAEGHGVALGRGWTYHLTHSLPYGVGVPVFVAAIGGVVPFARHHGRAAFVLGAFAAAFYFIVGSGYAVFFRYVLPLVPLVCLSASIGVFHGARWIVPLPGRAQARVLAVLIAMTAGPALVYSAWFDLVLARTDTRVLAGRWLEARLHHDHTLYDSGGPYSRLDLWRAEFLPWQYEESTESFGKPEGRTPDWLVLHESPLSRYASTPASLWKLAQSRYALVQVVRGTRAAGPAVYDLQDAFFMPVSGFWTVERPGPDIYIHRRRDLPPLDGAAKLPLPD
jgi:4-amino-4-deoxy-L-arabinose transferase-like glycosyltransferase